MEYTQRLAKVAVLGAAGKMGSGILLLTSMEMTELWLQDKNLQMELWAIDVSAPGLKGLMGYLEMQVLKAAEKKMVWLRKLYADRTDLIENGEILEVYVKDVMRMITPSTHLSDAYQSSLVFEAVKEDPDVKKKVLSELNQNGGDQTWFFTNTSSIPIGKLNEAADLKGRLIGFHFYNPPAIQKLVELIPSSETLPELVEFALQYAKNLRKTVVPSNDFAGFIGNGHFMRDALYGMQEAVRLSEEMPLVEAIWTINRISQDFLIRPMGIFQLIDYVGVDVVSYIMQVMDPYLPDEKLKHPLLDKLIELNVRGGQFSNGSQRDGFLKYEKGRPVAVFDPEIKSYRSAEDFEQKVDQLIGTLPEKLAWKSVNFSPNKASLLEGFFRKLSAMNTMGAKLARNYGMNSKQIGVNLVDSGVARSAEDVNRVLETGFYHAYGPINEYFKC